MADDSDEIYSTDSWASWRRHVLLEMEALRKGVEKLSEDVGNMKTEIALLKYKSSIWGAAGAALVVLIYVVVETVRTSGK